MQKKPKVFDKNADNIITRNRDLWIMAESFNLNNFLNTYKQTTYDPTKRDAAAKEHMEKNLEKKAEEAAETKTA